MCADLHQYRPPVAAEGGGLGVANHTSPDFAEEFLFKPPVIE